MNEESANPVTPTRHSAPGFFSTLPERLREPTFRNLAISLAVAFVLLIVLLAAWRSAAGARDKLSADLETERKNSEKIQQELNAVTQDKNKAIDDRRVAESELEKAQKSLKEISDNAANQQAQRVKAEEALTKAKSMLDEANKDRKDLADKYQKAADDADHNAKMRRTAETARDELTKQVQELKDSLDALQQKPKAMLANP